MKRAKTQQSTIQDLLVEDNNVSDNAPTMSDAVPSTSHDNEVEHENLDDISNANPDDTPNVNPAGISNNFASNSRPSTGKCSQNILLHRQPPQ